MYRGLIVLTTAMLAASCSSAEDLSPQNLIAAVSDEARLMPCSQFGRGATTSAYWSAKRIKPSDPFPVRASFNDQGILSEFWLQLEREGIATRIGGSFEEGFVDFDIAEEYRPNFLITRGEEVQNPPFGTVLTEDAYICLGEGKVTEVEDYTIPGEGGAPVTQATFRYEVDPPLGKSDLRHLVDGDIQPSGTFTRTVVLTNEGWKNQSEPKAEFLRTLIEADAILERRTESQRQDADEYLEIAQATGFFARRNGNQFEFKCEDKRVYIPLLIDETVEDFERKVRDVCV